MRHTCHARLCETRCRPTLLMCPKHWKMVPRKLQIEVYATYRRGQCDDKQPSEQWHVAADAAIGAVALKEGCPIGKLKLAELRALIVLAPEELGGELERVRGELDRIRKDRERVTS